MKYLRQSIMLGFVTALVALMMAPASECVPGGECPSGQFTDEYQDEFSLQTSSGVISGTYTHALLPCEFNISGSSQGEGGAVEFTATVVAANPECCDSVTFMGTANDDCSEIAGAFSSPCGLDGLSATLIPAN